MKKKVITTLVALLVGVVVLALALPTLLKFIGLHPDYEGARFNLAGKRALIITTSHGVLNAPGENDGEPTGVFSSEMTVPYYEFLDAQMQVDMASIKGGEIPVDPKSFLYMIKTAADDRFLEDPAFQARVKNSLRIDDVDISQYDVVFLAGGWGAAYDLGYSESLGQKVSEAYYAQRSPVIGAVCHGPLGLIRARDLEGNFLIAGRRLTAVTNKQIKELGIEITPQHPETELKKAGAIFESKTAFWDVFANHVVVDDEARFVTGQNQNAGHETAQKIMEIIAKR
jgi:putative intracellular protease/amidase